VISKVYINGIRKDRKRKSDNMRDWDNFDKMFDMLDKIMRDNFTGGIHFQKNNPKFPVEVIDDKENIYLTLSIGDIQQEDIFMDLTSNSIHFRILTENEEYERDITFPSEVDPKTIENTLKNGILDLTIKKK